MAKAVSAVGLMCLLLGCKGKEGASRRTDKKAAAAGVVERLASCAARLRIQVAYPGASPSEVESFVVMPIEEAVQTVKSVRAVHSYALEGRATVVVEIDSESPTTSLPEVKSALDGVTGFPEDAEIPRLTLDDGDSRFVLFVVHGPVSPVVLSRWVGTLRDRMLQSPSVGRVAIVGRPAREIRVEAARDKLDAYNLSPKAVAAAIRSAWLDAKGPARGSDLGKVAVPFGDRGKSLRLADIATITEGVSAHGAARLGDQPAVLVGAFGKAGAAPGALLEEAGTVAREHARPEIKMRVMGTVTIAGCGAPTLDLRGPVLVARVRVPGADAARLEGAVETALGAVRGKGDTADVVLIRGDGLLDLHALTPIGADSFELVGLADSEARVAVELAHADMDLLTRAEIEMRKRMSGHGSVLAVGSTLLVGGPQLDLRLTDRARAMGFTMPGVAARVRSATGAVQVGEIPVGRDHLPVVLRVLPEVAPANLAALPIIAPRGQRVLLGEVATIKRRTSPAEIYRRDQRRVVLVYAVLDAGQSSSDLAEKIRAKDLPALVDAFPGIVATVR